MNFSQSELPPSKAQLPQKLPVGIFYSDLFLNHDTGINHPESPDRLRAIVKTIKNSSLHSPLLWPPFSEATPAQITRVHTPAYFQLIQKEIGEGKKLLSTGDTVLSPGTLTAALLASGAGIEACDLVMKRKISSGFCLVRPPGHHATTSRGMGFCLLNHIAIAARDLQARHGIKKILIIDFDVHHGNGTQDIFYSDASVFYYSIHQQGIYPGTGHPRETGEGKGKGFTLNIELPAGSTDAEAFAAFQNSLIPAMKQFKPEFILISAGFDAHHADPIGGLAYTPQGYAAFTQEIQKLAKEYSHGRTVFMLEGGYGLPGLAASVLEVIKAISTP